MLQNESAYYIYSTGTGLSVNVEGGSKEKRRKVEWGGIIMDRERIIYKDRRGIKGKWRNKWRKEE